jgi:hypothetical protein
MVEEVDDSLSDAPAAVSVVHLNELDRKGGGSRWRNVSIVIDFDLIVQFNPGRPRCRSL